MGRPNPVKNKFSALIRERLTETYGRLPSAAFVAQEFNLRARTCEPVTQEAARRWLKGISMPEEEKLQILIDWLKLDISACFMGNPQDHDTSTSAAANSAAYLDAHKLAGLITRLPPAEQELLRKLAKKLGQARRYP